MASSTRQIVKLLNRIEQQFINIDDSFSDTLTSIIKSSLLIDDYAVSLVFNSIFKNYIKLLDTDRFVNVISKIHYEFLQQYFQLFDKYYIRDKTSEEIFFFLVDQINSSKRLILFIQNNLSDDNQILINTCGFILYSILSLLNHHLDYMLTNHDLDIYQNNLIKPFIEYIDQYFIRKENSIQQDVLIKQIGCLIWNISHRTPVIPILINANCPQACLRWLSLNYLDSSEYEFIVYILYNIARHDEGGSLLNRLNCTNVIRKFKKEILNTKTDFIINNHLYVELCQFLELTLSLVVDLDELYLEEVNNGTIREILSISRQRFECYSHLPISELLIILMKFFTNDTIMYYILHHDQCPKFLIMILNNDIEKNIYKFIENDKKDFLILSITAIANIFWSISFDDQYKNCLIQNINIIKKLETYSMDNLALYIHIPYQMSSLKRAMDGIFYNLYSSKLEIKPNLSNKKIYSLMISYSQVNINFCRELCEMLGKIPELLINVDFKNGKYSWKEIAETIEQSDAVIFLLSKEFYYSKSCRQEFIHVIDRLKKISFPIFIDSDWKPSGWIHKYVVRLKSIRFGDKDFLDTCEDLLTLINENLSMNISLIKNFSDVTKWNDNEIKQWFIDHQIISELYEFYHFQNGNELLLYANAILAFPWIKEYERVKVRFGEKQNLSQDQFLQFIHALKQLAKQT